MVKRNNNRINRSRKIRSSRNNNNTIYEHTPIVRGLNAYIQPTPTIVKTRFSITTDISTSAGGNILVSLLNTPSISPEFSAYQVLYDDYRLMGATLQFFSVPSVDTSGSSPTNGCVYIAYDFNDVVTPVSVGDVLSHGSRKVFQIYSLDRRPFIYNFKVPSQGKSTPIDWVPTTTTSVSFGSVKLAATGLTPSRDYLTAVIDYYVQFRGKI